MTTNNAVNAGSNGLQILNNTTGVYTAQALSAKGDLLCHTGAAYATQAVGTNDFVLTADSTQTNGIKWAAAGGVNPLNTVTIYEDWLNSATAGNYTWVGSMNAGGGTADHPGVVQSAGSLTTQAGVFLTNTSASTAGHTFVLGGGAFTLSWVFNIGTLSDSTNRYILRLGMAETAFNTSSDYVDGVYFEYSDNVNSGNWQIKTANASTRTTTNTATAAATGWQKITITVNAAATSVEYFINGSSVGTIATNIPTASISPICHIARTLGSLVSATLAIDLFVLDHTMTNSR